MGSLRERPAELSFLVPGDLTTRTGGYIYDRNIVDGLRRLGWKVDACSLDSSFPSPTANALSHAHDVLKSIPTGRIVVIDGLALAGSSALLRTEAARLRLVALIHHPLAMETGLDEKTAHWLRESERDALTMVRRVIVTSRWTARILAEDYAVAADRIVVVEPGVEVDISRTARTKFDVLNLLCVATLTARKGHAVLFEALSRLRDKNWTLRCVGSMQRDSATAQARREQVRNLGLGNRIEFLGELDEAALQQEYRRADAFVLASYIEGYGMALAEAAACGLPIVSTLAGAIPENAWSKAALLVPPGNVEALAEAISRLHDDANLRQQLSMNALAARNELPDWNASSQRFAAALEDLRVSSFSPEWLRLREPVDRAARTLTLPLEMLPIRTVVDLGAGTGANFRYIAPLLGGKQHWTLVEQDPVLVNATPECLREWADSCHATVVTDGDELHIHNAAFDCRVRTERIDLCTQLNRLAIPQGSLVTASALLDLVSEEWLTQLIKRCSQSASPVWFALTYDGQMQCNPLEPEDDLVRSLFNEHQRTDKGFGPALGPAATEMARQILAANGYETVCARSDWHLTPEMRAIQQRLVQGCFDAARNYSPERARELEGWLDRRRAHIDAGVSTQIVGHIDIVGRQTPQARAEQCHEVRRM